MGEGDARMRVSVFGLGYVGVVTGACLAESGHDVIGVDVDTRKVDMVNAGQSPIVEELIDEILSSTARSGTFSAICSVEDAVHGTDISFVCVGTPSLPNGALDTTYVARVAEAIGAGLASKSAYHVVAVRSTVLPGTVETIVGPVIEGASGKRLGCDFGLCFHPEFLREGTSVRDFRDPPKIVIGEADSTAGDALASLYHGFSAPLFRTSIRAAEMVKYADNCFHALKVVFGNEIGAICKAQAIDSHEVMRIFCQDTKLNISPAYLMPGFAYGGSCLPKDLRALLHRSRGLDLDLPVIENIQRSNEAHLARAMALIGDRRKQKIGLLGLSFKRGTDDLRESPLVELVERLIGKGHLVRIYDENVSLSKLLGGNKAYIEQKLPHLSELLQEDLGTLVQESDVIIVGSRAPEFRSALSTMAAGKTVIDLVRLLEGEPPPDADYHGLCW